MFFFGQNIHYGVSIRFIQLLKSIYQFIPKQIICLQLLYELFMRGNIGNLIGNKDIVFLHKKRCNLAARTNHLSSNLHKQSLITLPLHQRNSNMNGMLLFLSPYPDNFPYLLIPTKIKYFSVTLCYRIVIFQKNTPIP